MPMVHAGDFKINVEVSGRDDAPVLMLSNSLGTDLHMWDDQAKAFAEHFRLVRYDHGGHGRSIGPQEPYTMEMLGKHVVAILDDLKIRKANWCGLSMGGMIGMWLGANASDRFDKLVLSNTGAYYADKTPWNDRMNFVEQNGLRAMAGPNMERWFTKDFREREPETMKRMTEMLVATPVHAYLGCSAAVRDMDHRPLLPKISLPTLVIAGKQDPATTPAMAEDLVRNIPGSKLATVDAAHISNVEQPKVYAEIVLNFLRG